jgi:hypothetical protein
VKVREATADDKVVWDAFVDSEGGNFGHYFDWKHIHEIRGDQFIPVLIENNTHQVIGILPIAKENIRFYSVLHAHRGGLLLSNNLSDTERHEATLMLLEHVDVQYSKRCSRFHLYEHFPSIYQFSEEPTVALVESGFRFRYDKLTHLPCKFVIELKQPFEDIIWKGLWSNNFRNKLNKAKRKGVIIIHDQELNYFDDFVDMVFRNYKRHGTAIPPSRNEIQLELNAFSRDKTKLFVALLDNQPIAGLLCYYNASTCILFRHGSYEKDNQNANALCWATAIEDACNTGYRFADLTAAATPGLVLFKEQFKATRIPFGSYEKRYSSLRYYIEMVLFILQRVWRDKTYIWKIPLGLWDRIIHRLVLLQDTPP